MHEWSLPGAVPSTLPLHRLLNRRGRFVFLHGGDLIPQIDCRASNGTERRGPKITGYSLYLVVKRLIKQEKEKKFRIHNTPRFVSGLQAGFDLRLDDRNPPAPLFACRLRAPRYGGCKGNLTAPEDRLGRRADRPLHRARSTVLPRGDPAR
jgi:hypothetical protein